MYSPVISEELIHNLYHLAKIRKQPMTKLVNQMIMDSLRGLATGEKELLKKAVAASLLTLT